MRASGSFLLVVEIPCPLRCLGELSWPLCSCKKEQERWGAPSPPLLSSGPLPYNQDIFALMFMPKSQAARLEWQAVIYFILHLGYRL